MTYIYPAYTQHIPRKYPKKAIKHPNIYIPPSIEHLRKRKPPLKSTSFTVFYTFLTPFISLY